MNSADAGPRRGTTARGRIVAVLVALLAGTVALIVATTWIVLTLRDGTRTDAELTAAGVELDTLATTAVDPATGEQFTSARALLQAAVDRAVPAADETRFAVVDGLVTARSTRGFPGRLDQEPELISGALDATSPTLATVHTDRDTVRYITVPVTGDDDSGVYVVAIVRDISAGEVNRIVGIVAAIGVVGLAFAAVVGWIVAGRVLAPLGRLRVAATGITERHLDQRIAESGTDDVRALTRSFNTMLDRLDRAFTAQRRFAADAGHELRTPLTVLRGYTELLSDDKELRDDQRVVLLDEIDRMSAMVEDLLALTRLDRAPELQPEVLRTVDIMQRWQALTDGLPARTWSWIVDDDAIVADPRRLHQVFLQLAQNALAVTGPGAALEAGLVTVESTAVLWVADSGPGIPVAERSRVFEPFARGTARSEGGSGLGLAIVAGIARANGGRAEARDDRPVLRADPWPGGACITVYLPVPPPGPAADPVMTTTTPTTEPVEPPTSREHA